MSELEKVRGELDEKTNEVTRFEDIIESGRSKLEELCEKEVRSIDVWTYPDNSPGGQFPTVQVSVLMSGFIPW